MSELYARDRSLLLNEGKNLLEWSNVRVAPDAHIRRADAPFRDYSRGFHHDQRRAAHSPAAQVHQMPVIGQPSTDEYWHMGETRMRLRNSTSRRRRGSNKWLIQGFILRCPSITGTFVS